MVQIVQSRGNRMIGFEMPMSFITFVNANLLMVMIEQEKVQAALIVPDLVKLVEREGAMLMERPGVVHALAHVKACFHEEAPRVRQAFRNDKRFTSAGSRAMRCSR